MKKEEKLKCPSYPAVEGAKLFGIINSNGFVDYLKSTIEVDRNFLEHAKLGRETGKRFRFSGTCAKKGCGHWDNSGGNCNLVERILNLPKEVDNVKLQECPIRSNCRWYKQRGAAACHSCSEVIRKLEARALDLK